MFDWSYKMAKKKTKAEQIASMSPEAFARMWNNGKRSEMVNYIRTLRSSYKRRVGSFKRKGLISYAQLAFEKQVPPGRPIQLTKMTFNQLLHEFAKYSSFFNSTTATEKGIKAVNREQDIRLFGQDSRGRPNHTMTAQERIAYWDLYDEYINQYPGADNRYRSETVQQFLADALYGSDTIPTNNLVNFFRSLEQRLREGLADENLRRGQDVYRGKGPAF